MEIKTALISVSNKEGIIELAKFLQEKNVKIISSGGTYSLLKEKGINAIKVSDITGFPEILDGRVKTLHPNIHGGILADNNNENHIAEIEKHDIKKIDLVIVNLYPFEDTVHQTQDEKQIIENIDIGGPAMIRAAAKNFSSTVVLSASNQYEDFIKNFENLNLEKRKSLAFKAFSRTARYDSLIAKHLDKIISKDPEKNTFPNNLSFSGIKVRNLRYGENPHQKASLYAFSKFEENCIITAQKLGGKELSYNNLVDADAALEIITDFKLQKACCIVKHANPCGVAVSSSLISSLENAIKCDELSSFGGIFAFSQEVDLEVANFLSKRFLEIIIAPNFSAQALDILQKKKNLIILKVQLKEHQQNETTFKNIKGGFIVQDIDSKIVSKEDILVTTKISPDSKQIEDLLFAFKVIKHVHSNAIVITKNGATIGIGAGQMSRVDAVKIAINKAIDSGFTKEDLRNSTLASDAFFPFPDSINYIAEYGISSIIQPGGSIRDSEVIEACNNYGISMVFSGTRSFKH
jgi:phosphoribosylaminoimidazolecarboxamide formyltransferase/IMP cyclohydrolase